MTLEQAIEYALKVGEGDTERASAKLLYTTFKSDRKPRPPSLASAGEIADVSRHRE
jgi:hypothetical protein